MLDLKIIAIGKLKDENIRSLADDYAKRIKPFARIEIVELTEESFVASNAKQAKEREGEKILEALVRFPGSFAIALDEHGKEFDSIDLASYLEKQNKTITLIIGGSQGISEKALEYCQGKLALSRLTFTHEMARLFLLEQLYRSITIINGKKYHH